MINGRTRVIDGSVRLISDNREYFPPRTVCRNPWPWVSVQHLDPVVRTHFSSMTGVTVDGEDTT